MLSWVLVYDGFGATGSGSACNSCAVWSSEVLFSLYLLLASVVEKADTNHKHHRCLSAGKGEPLFRTNTANSV